MSPETRRKPGPALAALLYGAAALAAIGAPGWLAAGPALALEAQTRDAFAAAAAEALPKLVVHDEPRPRLEAGFADGAGAPVSLDDFAGRVVVLNIWATWCPPCRKEMPSIDRLARAVAGDGIAVVALSTDRGGAKPVRKFFEEIGVETLEIHVDKAGRLPREAAVIGLPATLILDRKGREIARLTGDAEWDTPEIVAMLRALAAATAPERAGPAFRTVPAAGGSEDRAEGPLAPETRAANGTPLIEGKARDVVNRDSPLAGTAL
jgi:thiol-disulfide isomerase/thioredoxin